jgi:hypothetical protein
MESGLAVVAVGIVMVLGWAVAGWVAFKRAGECILITARRRVDGHEPAHSSFGMSGLNDTCIETGRPNRVADGLRAPDSDL